MIYLSLQMIPWESAWPKVFGLVFGVIMKHDFIESLP
jgi:hypothetical protein